MPIKDPVQLFQTIVARMNAEDWNGAAGLCDPASLSSFRRTILEQFSPNRRPVTITAEQFMKMEPDMPREVAEYNVKRAQKSVDSEGRLQSEFPTVASVAALRALEPADLFAEFLYGRSPKRQLREQAKRGDISKKNADAILQQPLNELQYEPVGFLPDGDRIAHVLYRMKVEVPTGPREDEWLAMVPEEEREFAKDTLIHGHAQMFNCRKQPDGGWLAIADYSFIGGGMNVSFVPRDGGDDYEEYEELAIELSP
jgi:hypothetical protein